MERDVTLGYEKYTDRRDDLEYYRIAEKVVADRLTHPTTPVAPAPMTRPA